MIDKLESIVDRFRTLEEQLSDPSVIGDMDRFKKVNKEYKDLKEIVETFLEFKQVDAHIRSAKELLREKDAELQQMAQAELDELQPRIEQLEEKLKFLIIPQDPEDSRDVLFEIRSGTGGDEASLFAGDLYRMYSKYFEKQGWKTEAIEVNEGTVGGYNKLILEVSGNQVFGKLKFESGVHRVQRVPKTESQGRIHTSAVTVAVMPKLEMEDVNIVKSDLRVETFRSSGAGGQHVNKTDSAIRITHVPTGVVVSCQSERSQHSNRDKAMKMLRARMYEQEMLKRNAEKQALEDSKADIGWGSQIRSYVLDDSRIKDLRTGVQTSNCQAVLDGDLDDFIEASLKAGL